MSFLDYNCFEILDIFRITRKACACKCSPNIRFWSAISYRISGQSTFHINDKVVHTGENCIVYLPSYTAFVRKSTEEEMIVVHLKYYDEGEKKEIEALYSSNCLAVLTQFYNLVNIWEEKSPGYQHRASAMLHMSEEYFRKLYKEAYGISPHNAIIDKRIKKACRLLQSGFFSVNEVAEKVGFTNSKYFSTLFHKAMNMSPIAYKKLFSS
ncbi:MAG: helix-turn-helix domain-containing protein [Ruminococcaceae bacterium]|nr:helix-turn-helix domain-containing protein [Oscillospiraceae bacterium]